MKRYNHEGRAVEVTVPTKGEEKAMGVGLFKRLDMPEEAAFRQWARDNYKPFDPIKGIWHPTVQDECVKMNSETGYAPPRLPDTEPRI